MAKKKKKQDDREIVPSEHIDVVGVDPTQEPGYIEAPNPALDAAVTPDFSGVARLTRDMKKAAALLSRREARYLLDAYYQMQDSRIAERNRIRAGTSFGEPVAVLSWFANNSTAIENDLKNALGTFAKQYRVGNWLQSITGIGPILSAGFMAQLDVPPPPTVGNWWRFAGLDPSVRWWGTKAGKAMIREITGEAKKANNEHLVKIAQTINMDFGHLIARLAQEGFDQTKIGDLEKFVAKRPWNKRLKCMSAFIAGESFVKVQNNPNDFYGKLYVQYKARILEKNLNGDYAEAAAAALARLHDKTTPAYKANAAGFLAPGHIHNRARRWTAKLFLSHIHTVCYWDYYGVAPPAPFIFNKCPDQHTHYIPPPNWSEERLLTDFPGKSLKEMTGLELTTRIAPIEEEEESGDAE
jgi:hypothetical protein